MVEHQVLFCPFCRDSFEGRSTCPACELALVPLEKLPPAEHEQHEEPEPDGEPVLDGDELLRPLLHPGHGRAVVALGALLVCAALPLGLVRFASGPPLRTYELARALPSLWSLGLIGFTVFYALMRRRSARALRGLRVLVPLLGLLPPGIVGWVLYRRFFGSDFGLGPAVYSVALGSLLLIVGGLRLGGRAPATS